MLPFGLKMDCIEIPVANETVNEQGKSVSHVLISKVLCFIHHHLQNCAPDHVKTVAVASFTCEEIVSAKKLLWGSHVKDHLKVYQERRTSSGRKLEDANVADLIDALKDLDQKEIFVHCAVMNIKDFPSFSPERLNTVAMLKRLELLETQYRQIENAANKNTIDICTMQDLVRKQDSQLSECVNTVATHGVLINKSQQISSDQAGQESSVSRDNLENAVSEGEANATDTTQEDNYDEDDGGFPDQDDVPTLNAADEEAAAPVNSNDEVPEPVRLTSGRPAPHNDEMVPQLRSAPVETAPRPPTGNRVPVSARRQESGPSYATAARPPRQNQPPFHRRIPPMARQSAFVRSNTRNAGPSLTAHRPRTDADGFTFQRHQLKQNRKNTLKKVYIGNVDKRHVVEDVIDFLSYRNISVSGVFQRSHYTAAKKSFVCFMNDYNFRLLCNERDCQSFEIREYVDSGANTR